MAKGGGVDYQSDVIGFESEYRGNLVKSKTQKSLGIGRIQNINRYLKKAYVDFENGQEFILLKDLIAVNPSKKPQWIEDRFGENSKRTIMKWNGKTNGYLNPNYRNEPEPEPDTDMLDYYDSRISSDPSLKDNIKYPKFDDEYEFEKSSRNEPDTEMLDFYSEKGGMMAKGGLLEHGLQVGDEIMSNSANLIFVRKNGKSYVININTGKRLTQSEFDKMDNSPQNSFSRMAKGGRTGRGINKKYAYFAVDKKDMKIVNAWELTSDVESLKYYAKQDLIDDDRNPKEFSILSKNYLISQSIDPFDLSNWKN